MMIKINPTKLSDAMLRAEIRSQQKRLAEGDPEGDGVTLVRLQIEEKARLKDAQRLTKAYRPERRKG